MNIMREGSMLDRTFTFLGQMIVLNLLWMICSLPVITAGASTTALFYCMLKLRKYDDVRVFKDFFSSFKQNFVQSTLVWIVMAALAGLIWMEKDAASQAQGDMTWMLGLMIVAFGIPLVMTALYIFPVIAAFENKTKTLIANAFFFSVRKFGSTIAMAVITILPMTMTLVDAELFPVYLFIWLLFGFSLTAYADSWFIWKQFKPYFKDDDDEESKYKDMETDRYAL